MNTPIVIRVESSYWIVKNRRKNWFFFSFVYLRWCGLVQHLRNGKRQKWTRKIRRTEWHFASNTEMLFDSRTNRIIFFLLLLSFCSLLYAHLFDFGIFFFNSRHIRLYNKFTNISFFSIKLKLTIRIVNCACMCVKIVFKAWNSIDRRYYNFKFSNFVNQTVIYSSHK